MKEILIPRISPYSFIFPDPRNSSKEGLVAFGGDLDPNRVLSAYKKGIFPWYNEGDPILWWSPDPRLVLYPHKLKISRSLKKILKKNIFEVKVDTAFYEVIKSCQTVKRREQEGTWILPEIVEVFTKLHHMGFAHSIEVYKDGELVGGLYGLSLGAAFFGESMFSKVSDTSKVALVKLVEISTKLGFNFIDCQISSDHLKKMGAEEISRERFLDELEIAMQKPSKIGKWELGIRN
ncbi:leucyl/phenylalanyl-tRNA--protein transferase [Nitrosophilus labii]|uniref:leucyl/phenylalanyl-tRNA--protein transferase n=1 Tax=Nitrosophilus labii TaxID=2706014 RepID=UPI001656BBA0|nr:leucyl/phenylalanyl-tRNA--protein transferase [Nitrosophilus labii]